MGNILQMQADFSQEISISIIRLVSPVDGNPYPPFQSFMLDGFNSVSSELTCKNSTDLQKYKNVFQSR